MSNTLTVARQLQAERVQVPVNVLEREGREDLSPKAPKVLGPLTADLTTGLVRLLDRFGSRHTPKTPKVKPSYNEPLTLLDRDKRIEARLLHNQDAFLLPHTDWNKQERLNHKYGTLGHGPGVGAPNFQRIEAISRGMVVAGAGLGQKDKK